MSNLVVNRKNMFLETPDFDVKKNYFDLSFLHARDMEVGKLYPIGLIRTMPGDKVKCSVNIKGYMESLLKNGFYNFRLNIRAYYSRFSDLDPLAEGVLTGGPDGDFDGTFPSVYLYGRQNFRKPYDSLQDCFGLPLAVLPTSTIPSSKINALPYIMYDLVYYNHYIDSVVEDNISNYIVNTPLRKKNQEIEGLTNNNTRFYNPSGTYGRMFDTPANFRKFLLTHGYPEVQSATDYSDADLNNFLYNVNYVKDRYTSAKLSEQLGTPPRLPIDLNSAFEFENAAAAHLPLVSISPDASPTFPYYLQTAGEKGVELSQPKQGGTHLFGAPIVGVDDYAQNWDAFFKNALQASVSSFSVSDMRLAFQTQIIQESIMIGGWEYYEYAKTFFGVDLKDRVKYRPRYIGGTRKSFIVNDVFSTVATTDAPLGTYAGRGSIDTEDFLIDTYCEDFGYIMIMAYIDTDGAFYASQGVQKEWLDRERFNFPNPAFYHLSMQGIKDSELYISSATTTLHGDVFGFQGIYNEWRQKTDYVTGSLRDELSFWHSARIFDNEPMLNPEFLKVKQKDYDRLFAVESDLYKPFIMGFAFKCVVSRNLPSYPLPGLIDHR